MSKDTRAGGDLGFVYQRGAHGEPAWVPLQITRITAKKVFFEKPHGYGGKRLVIYWAYRADLERFFCALPSRHAGRRDQGSPESCYCTLLSSLPVTRPGAALRPLRCGAARVTFSPWLATLPARDPIKSAVQVCGDQVEMKIGHSFAAWCGGEGLPKTRIR